MHYERMRSGFQTSPHSIRRILRLEPLESRQLLATLVSSFVVSYQDLDGDQVQVRLSQPLLTPGNVNAAFHFSAGSVNGTNTARQGLETLDLTPLGAAPGLSILVNVVRRARLGDGVASVGLIDATGKSLGTVRVSGDLGAIVAGDYDLTARSINTVVSEILARYDDNRDGQVNIHTNDIDGVEIASDEQTVNTFSQMDGDFNLRISRTELATYLSKAVDTNSNAQLSSLELGGYIARDPISSSHLLARRGIDALSVRSLGDTAKLPRSITATVDEVFRRYDVNANGQIQFTDPAEVPQDAQHVNTFSQMDANSDSRISRTELAAYFSRAVDTNSDNTLSTLELGGFEAGGPIGSGHLFGRSFQFPRRLDTAVSAILHQYDANGDGLINLDQTSAENEVTTPDGLNTFSSMDGDFDAFVDTDDIQSWVTDNADLDKNGTLTPAELNALRLQDTNAFNTLFSSFPSHVFGNLGTLGISQHLIGTQLRIDGTLQNATVGGSVLNADVQGEIAPTFNLQRITVGGNLEGRIVADRDLAFAQVNGSMLGGSDDNSANLGAGRDLAFARVVGDVVGGTGFASGVLFANRHAGTVIVGGSLRGGGGDFSGTVLAVGNIRSVGIGRDLVGGATEAAPFAFGFTHHTGLVRGRRIGEVTVGRDVRAAANGLTGIQAAETLGVVVIGRDVIGQPNNPVIVSAGGEPLTLARAAEDILKRYDKNKNGFVDLAQNLARREVTNEQQINTFSQMDANSDSRISRTEIAEYLSRAVDENADEVLSALELATYEAREPISNSHLFGSGGPSTPLAEIAAQILRRYDTSRDNRIDLRQAIARKEVKEGAELNTFGSMDDNFDNLVTAAEIVAYFARSVDSDADQHLIPLEASNFAILNPDESAVLFTAPGIELTPSSGLTDVAIASLVVGRDLVRTEIRAGYDVELSPIDGDAQIRSILVGRDWIGSSALAGVVFNSGPAPAIAAEPAGEDFAPPPIPPIRLVNLPGILSRIDTITIGRSLSDDPASDAAVRVIAAQEVVRVVIGGRVTTQLAGAFNDDLFLTPTGKTRLRESPRQSLAPAP